MENEELAKKISEITKQMENIATDPTVPKNVRTAVSEAKGKLNAEGTYTVRISGAIYCIDNISNDINLPAQARTMIWHILSMLESLKG